MAMIQFFNPTQYILDTQAIEKIGPLLARDGITRVLLLAGGGSIRTNGVYDRVLTSLKEQGIDHEEVWGVRPNPVLSKVREALAKVNETQCQAVLAVGGGSVIDSAKAVAAGVYEDDPWTPYAQFKAVSQALPIYVVLTLSATASEMNSGTVLTNEETRQKWSTRGPALFPRVALVDPTVQADLPPNQTVNGVVDAMSHLLEFHFMNPGCEPVVAISEALQRTLLELMPKLRANPNDVEARANFAWTATLALNGMQGAGTVTGDWATHMLEHSLSAVKPDVAHGEGLAVLFPAWISYVHKEFPRRFARWAKNVWQKDSVEQAIQAMRDTYRSWNAPSTLRELGFNEADIPELVDLTFERGAPGNMKKLTREDASAIYHLAL